MPDIKGFKGIRYNPEKIKNFTDVITQPYDQISDDMEKSYRRRSPYNFVNLVLTKYAEGHDRPREYEHARQCVQTWLRDQIFIQDEQPGLYPYFQEFTIHDQKYIRKGFFCVLKLEALGQGGILPHEKTLAKPKEDRMNLTRKTKKDFEPVFLLYTDPANAVMNMLEEQCIDSPLIDVTDENKVVHKLWHIVDSSTIEKIAAQIKNSTLVIADGHHRYETFYTYSQEMRDGPADHPAKYKMVVLVNVNDPGLVILPTHRLIKNAPVGCIDCLAEKAGGLFEVRSVPKKNLGSELAKEQDSAFGVYGQGGSYLFRLKSKKIVDELLPDKSTDYRRLDTAILQAVVIEKLMGIPSSALEDHVKYERGIDETLARVDQGEFQFALLLKPTHPDQVMTIASHGERMPQKSTDFFPKLISGLVFYDIAG